MTLNMKNYKGYDKKPYCSAHYPQTKATVVADTPELQRLARNTELQSQVKYHEEFEKKIKGSKIQISDDPETQRLKHLNSVVSEVEYKGIREKTGNMESRRQSLPPTSEKPERWLFSSNTGQSNDPKSPASDRNTSTSIMYKADGKVEAPRQKRIGSIADYDPVNENYGSLAQGYNPVSRMSQSQEWEETIPVSPSGTPSTYIIKKVPKEEQTKDIEKRENEAAADVSKEENVRKEEQKIEEGRVSGEASHVDTHNGVAAAVVEDSDVFEEVETIKNVEAKKCSTNKVEATECGRKERDKTSGSDTEVVHVPTEKVDKVEHVVEDKLPEKIEETKSVESAEIHSQNHKTFEDVTAEQVPLSTILETKHEQMPAHVSESNVEVEVQETAERVEEEQPEEPEVTQNDKPEDDDVKVTETKPLSGAFVALYDYEAQDEDEVGFNEGDQIVDCESVDEGWMIATVVRTSERGMLPSNYVQQVI